MKTLIKNAWILTMDEVLTTYPKGMLIIEDDQISYVGEYKAEMEEHVDEIIDAAGGLLIPGMINTHGHVSMIPFRSLGDDCPDRLRRYLFPLEIECMTAPLVYEAARYGILEMQRSGVTTFLDMYYFEEEVARACDELNMRVVLGETVISFPTCDCKEAYGGLAYSEAFISKWKNHKLVTPIIAPHATNTNDATALKTAHEIAEKYDTLISMHVAEMDYEVSMCKEKYNLTPVGYLDKLGILDHNFISAHTILVDDEDINILRKKNVKVSHNISANSKGAKGVCPILKMKDNSIDIGLGTDGPMSSNTLDIISQMSQVGKIHKLFNNDRTLLPSDEIVEMATMGGARVLGLDKIVGSIEVGKKADLVLIETKSVNMQPIYDYYATIVYSSNPSNVHTVIVDGKIVVRNKELVSGDFSKIRKDLLGLKDKVNKLAKNL